VARSGADIDKVYNTYPKSKKQLGQKKYALDLGVLFGAYGSYRLYVCPQGDTVYRDVRKSRGR
jgi:hypothetical protein